MAKDNIISQLAFSLDIESGDIDDIKEGFYSYITRPDYSESLSNNVESKSFDKYLDVYV